MIRSITSGAMLSSSFDAVPLSQQRHHHMAGPARAGVALIGLRGAAQRDVFHRAEAHDPEVGVQHRRELRAEEW